VTHVGAEKLAPVIMGPDDYTNVLRPQHGNIHQVETVDGPAAIFDLLVPPYDTCAPETGPRRCRFFKEMHTSKGLQLTVVSQHKGYWNDVAPYKGPSISLYSNQQNAI
jgi:cysteamine dioxygenase